MSAWMKSLTGCLCILTILLHLLPRGRFEKYVRFYGGLLFFLVAMGPLLDLLAGDGALERLLSLEFLREEYFDLETASEGMAELKNDRILEAYRREIRRQAGEIAAAYGLETAEVSLTFDAENAYRLTGISMVVSAGAPGGWGPQEDAALEAARRELAGVYALGENQIRIRRREAAIG